MALRTVKTGPKPADLRKAKPLPHQADQDLRTKEHRSWADAVKARAGHKCEACGREGVTLYADHVHERRDGGDLQGKGQALCGSCHGRKTARERAKRMGLV